MNDKERLVQWMKANDVGVLQLARATGDHGSAISMMTNGPREVNQAFMWRFAGAYGYEVAKQIFIDNPMHEHATETA